MTDEATAGVAVQELATAVADAVERAIIGKREAVELVLFALLADGHVLIEDLPGLGKTLLARSFAQVCTMDFARIQFTPDLIPSDITGASIYDRSSGSFTFERGPIFTNILLADEINRAPGKTQAALLEAMEERQVTLENTTRQLDSPFLVLATQNPIEYEGTYPLPEAQLDRFLLRTGIGYPARADEAAVLGRRLERGRDEAVLDRVVDAGRFLAMQRAVELSRARDETPTEFTARVLGVLGASAGAASDLTGLFELARFSHHPMNDEDRRRASASIRRVEAEVAPR